MIKYLLLCIASGPFFMLGQDTLVPMVINPYIEDVFETRSGNSIDSTFQYTYSNLDLPVFDDFSVNKWVKYITDYSAPNVTSVLYYYLFDINGGAPIPASTSLCDTTTAHKKTVIIASGSVIDSTYENFTTGFPVNVTDLNNFPIMGEQLTLFTECYIIIDTIVDGVLNLTQDTIFSSPNYIQDSARVFTADISNTEIWVDDFACHNYRFAVEPKSLGVATLDGVSRDGFPYEFGNTNAYGKADELTSKPINMAGKSNVYISFLYQAKGFGNSPESQDSLILEMYSPGLDTWFKMWATDGNVVDNEWNRAHIEITASTFLQDGYKFRFSNKASLAGQLDHWHVDYVNLRENSSINDTIIDDLAISYPIESFLKSYSVVPWDHYNNLNDPGSKMIDNYELLVMNNHTAAKITNAGQLNIDGNNFSLPVSSPNWIVGANIYTFNVGNQPYFYPQNSGIDKADFKVKMNIATSTTNQITENDTTYFTQEFKNFYAYDDGTAESGYGVLDNNAQIAYHFEAYEADTLTGILMKFIPNVNDITGNLFLLTVWEDSSGLPGKILYKDDFFNPHFPNYASHKNQYSYYKFNGNKAIPVPEKFFVGFEQIADQNLYLGFDLNNNNQSKIFYNTGGSWTNASFPGSLIMRPVFSTALNYTLKVQPILPEKISFHMYPNPVSSQLTIENLPSNYSVKIFDLSGRQVLEHRSSTIDFSYLDSGFYMVSINNEQGKSVFTQKIIKQ